MESRFASSEIVLDFREKRARGTPPNAIIAIAMHPLFSFNQRSNENPTTAAINPNRNAPFSTKSKKMNGKPEEISPNNESTISEGKECTRSEVDESKTGWSLKKEERGLR